MYKTLLPLTLSYFNVVDSPTLEFYNLEKLLRFYFVIFQISVKLAPYNQHFSNFMRVLVSFAIVPEFLIGFRNSSGVLMHKITDFRNAELTSRISSTLSEKQVFFPSSVKIEHSSRVPVNFINSSGKLRKIWLLKISTIFLKISFSRVPKILFRVLDSTQIVLQKIPNTFCFKIKIQKTMTLQNFQIIFENLIFESFKTCV